MLLTCSSCNLDPRVIPDRIYLTYSFFFTALSYRWYFNEFPNFIRKDDGRWFVSQVTGNLYLAKAELNDTGNYFCFTTMNLDINTKSTFSKGSLLTVMPDGMTTRWFSATTVLQVWSVCSLWEIGPWQNSTSLSQFWKKHVLQEQQAYL